MARFLEGWEAALARWVEAGLLSAQDASRVRAWEAERSQSRGPGWPVVLALGFGALLLSAGVLLFVAAHWDALGSAARFSLVLALVALFHAAGAAAVGRFPALATALHAVGTVALGGGIHLAGQIFNLQEHWPTGVLLWALGAGAGVVLLRDWPQTALLALLVPAWLATERMAEIWFHWDDDSVLAQSLFLLAVVYSTARTRTRRSATHRALVVIGAAGLLPTTIYLFSALDHHRPGESSSLPALVVGFGVAIAAGFMLRRKEGWTSLVAALWVLVAARFDVDEKNQLLGLLCWCVVASALFVALGVRDGLRYLERIGWLGLGASVFGLLSWAHEHERIFPYPLCIGLALAVVTWGVRFSKKDAINSGVLLFGLSVAFFYFSNVMDRLGRSASLIGLGLLFLGGGFALERARRKLLHRAVSST